MIERLLAAERALADGQLDEAEGLFRQVAEADRRNAIAVVGLAEVALARGDRRAAADLARQALAVDPDDAAAARILGGAAEVEIAERPSLVARLRAVLRRLGGRGG
jgi:thioredoxin-like negative regulator of GroEL